MGRPVMCGKFMFEKSDHGKPGMYEKPDYVWKFYE
jgi:hypothetical protein